MSIAKIESRFQCKISSDLISSTYTYLQVEGMDKIHISQDHVSKDYEAAKMMSYLHENELFYDEIPFSTYLDEGAEQKVFHDTKRNRVIKLNDGIFYTNWSQYFVSLLVHNILFPETAYLLKGFVRINESLFSIVEQDYIVATEHTSIDQVHQFMRERGFHNKRRNDFLHDQLGLLIEDLHEENVLTRDGVLFFIDTVIYLL